MVRGEHVDLRETYLLCTSYGLARQAKLPPRAVVRASSTGARVSIWTDAGGEGPACVSSHLLFFVAFGPSCTTRPQ